MLTDQPLKQILQWPNTSSRLLKWSIELGEFHIDYRPRMTIKVQALADFIAEFTYGVALDLETEIDEEQEVENNDITWWNLFLYELSNQHGCSTGLVLQTLSTE